MRHDDYFGAFADQRLNGRGEPFDASCIGYLAIFDRDVQIGAQQHRLAADIDVVEGVKFRHGSTHSWLAPLSPAAILHATLYADCAPDSFLISADLASSLRIRELVVLLVNEDEGNQNSQIKPEGGLLAVPTGRLPHLKPFTTDNHKTEEPYQEAAGSADEDEPFGAVEAVCAGAQLPQQSDRRARQRQAG